MTVRHLFFGQETFFTRCIQVDQTLKGQLEFSAAVDVAVSTLSLNIRQHRDI